MLPLPVAAATTEATVAPGESGEGLRSGRPTREPSSATVELRLNFGFEVSPGGRLADDVDVEEVRLPVSLEEEEEEPEEMDVAVLAVLDVWPLAFKARRAEAGDFSESPPRAELAPPPPLPSERAESGD